MTESDAPSVALEAHRPAAPVVEIGPGPRHEAATRVRLEDWEGPLGLLLSLIEARRLDILTVPLGSLAESYLEALALLEGDRIGSVSAFVSVASTLILIKSRALLPRRDQSPPGLAADIDAPDPEAMLRERLLLYRAYRDAGLRLVDLAADRFGLFRREPGPSLAAALAGARPPDRPPLDPALLTAALADLARVAEVPAPPAETLQRMVTLAQRAAVIRLALRGAGVVVLQELLRGVRDRVVVAITFLALLELVKRREVAVEQAEPFGPITARKLSPKETTGAGQGNQS